MKQIGVLTSGGDTPGMNAAIRAVVKVGMHMGYSVMGIYHGYTGLIEGRIHRLQPQDVDGIISTGGTILRTARSKEFRTEEGKQQALKIVKAYGMDGIVVIGGDGSLNGATELAQLGVRTIGLPGTIDNDLGYTDYTIGFDTAINSVMGEIARIRDTMRSHDRVGVVEVMGRLCGEIALRAGLAGGAEYVLVPERKSSWRQIAQELSDHKQRGKFTSIVIIAEGAGGAQEFAEFVRSHSDVDIKPIVLGYIQRGGSPTAFDRLMASNMGERAVELIAQGASSRAVGIRENRIVDLDIEEALAIKPNFQSNLLELNEILSSMD